MRLRFRSDRSAAKDLDANDEDATTFYQVYCSAQTALAAKQRDSYGVIREELSSMLELFVVLMPHLSGWKERGGCCTSLDLRSFALRVDRPWEGRLHYG